MSDSMTALIVVGSIIGFFLLALLMFYSAYQRLPYWLSNVLKVPPVWSCNQSYSPACSLSDISISSRMVFVGVLPFIYVSCLSIAALVHTPDKAKGSWDDFMPLLDCAAEIAKEQGTKVVDLRQGAQDDFAARVAATSETCGTLAAAELETGRQGTTYAAAYYGYDAAFAIVHRRAVFLLASNAAEESIQLRELLSFISATAIDNDCTAVRDATKQNRGSSQAAAMGVIDSWESTMQIVGSLLAALRADTVLNTYAANYEWNEVRASVAMAASEVPLTLPQYDVARQAANVTTHVRSLVSNIYLKINDDLSESFDDRNYSVFLATVLLALSLVVSGITAAVSVALLVMHKREIEGDVVIKKDFDSCDAHKDKLLHYVNCMGTLQLENLKPTTSVVEERFYDMCMNLLSLKPFISHSLFEGDLGEETEQYPGGRTAAYSLRTEIGMCFTPCSCITISTGSFDDFAPQKAFERRTDIIEDYNMILSVVTAVASEFGGVVHHVGGGVIICTWNCTIACDQPTERALSAAFMLDKEYCEHAKQKSFAFVTEKNLVCRTRGSATQSIAVCTGDVMGGLIKSLPNRKLLIGYAPLQAERMIHMCPLFGVSVLIDQDTQTRVSDRYFTKPVTVIKDAIIYEALQRGPESPEKMRDYTDCFAHLKKHKYSSAMKCLEAYMAKPISRNDKTAKFLMDRILLKLQTKGDQTDVMPL